MNEQLKKLAQQAGIAFDSSGAPDTFGSLPDFLARFAALVRQDEREAFAKLCESLFDAEYNSCNEAEQCAAAIRAKGNHGQD
jgi:hypothetical protein